MRRRIHHPICERLLILVVGILLQAWGCERAPDTDGASSRPAADTAPANAAAEPGPAKAATEPAPTKADAPPAPEKSDAVDLIEGPVTTFERACAGCHGPQGAFHDESLAKMADDKLREMVEQMMRGPGQLQPTPVQLEAMIAYQRSLRDRRPFACVTNAAAFLSGKDIALQGEVSPGASVQSDKAGARIAATVNGMVWTLAQPPRPPFAVIASKGPLQVQIDFPAEIWSK
jgi:mono/diheme cytochrome c family protein